MTPARYQLTPIPFTAVQFSDPFWALRIQTNRAATIPHIYRKLEKTGRIGAFDLAFERPVPSPIRTQPNGSRRLPIRLLPIRSLNWQDSWIGW
jgi:hypothetical protein